MDASPILAMLGHRRAHALTLLAIDGHSAAGKSSLARAVKAAYSDAILVHTDDFYRPLDAGYRAALDAAGGYAEYYDWKRLEAQVLSPLRSGSAARYQRYDWTTNGLAHWLDIKPEGLVIVEGCYSARPELRRYYDAIVFVTASEATRQRRQRLRDDAPDEWLERWDAAERHYIQRHAPEGYADLVVPGE